MESNRNIELARDPVCGMTKPKNEMKAQAEYKGTTYYFCSDGDKEIFEAHPEHWPLEPVEK